MYRGRKLLPTRWHDSKTFFKDIELKISKTFLLSPFASVAPPSNCYYSQGNRENGPGVVLLAGERKSFTRASLNFHTPCSHYLIHQNQKIEMYKLNQINSPEVKSLSLRKVFHYDETMDLDKCVSRWDLKAFFMVAYHLENLAHMVHDNTMPLSANIITAPGCGGRIPCE